MSGVQQRVRSTRLFRHFDSCFRFFLRQHLEKSGTGENISHVIVQGIHMSLSNNGLRILLPVIAWGYLLLVKSATRRRTESKLLIEGNGVSATSIAALPFFRSREVNHARIMDTAPNGIAQAKR